VNPAQFHKGRNASSAFGRRRSSQRNCTHRRIRRYPSARYSQRNELLACTFNPSNVRAHFIRGKWQNAKTEVQTNDLGKKNGIIRSWLDGVLVFEKTDVEFRIPKRLTLIIFSSRSTKLFWHAHN
jgi:hypothetical protein